MPPPTFLSHSHTPSQCFPCPKSFQGQVPGARDHPCSPEMARITQTSQSYTVYPALTCLPTETPIKALAQAFPSLKSSTS